MLEGRSLPSGAIFVAALGLVGLLGPILAPHDPIEQLDPTGGRHLPPLSTRYLLELDTGQTLLVEQWEARDQEVLFLRLGEWSSIPGEDLEAPPTRRYFFAGTDRYGRDLLSRLLHGAQVSLGVGVLAALLSLALGVSVGTMAALGPRWLDGVVMRGVDALLAFPRLFLLLALAAYGPGSKLEIIVLLGLTSWMGLARLVRAEVKGLQATDYVLAAKGLGVPPWRLLLLHLLPNALPPILVETAFRVGDTILLEATLSFLGLGIQPPAASWGNLVADGWDSPLSGWWVSLFPGAALAATIFAFSRLGDGLQTLFDPRAPSRYGPRET